MNEITNRRLLRFHVSSCLHYEQSFLHHCLLELTDFHRHLDSPPPQIRCTLTNSTHPPNLSQHQITINQSLTLTINNQDNPLQNSIPYKPCTSHTKHKNNSSFLHLPAFRIIL